ncbi:Chromate transporter [Geobacter metallireducens RCH3]|uniref:Chromate transport protein ChrA, subunit 2, putative n=1 Tax=Geobacter metallireducens (strain ATCC 53774 / DSM 7210 / GS-15) TaxID=269799 RepID=Q39S25_GEOMG|nr:MULTISPECIES: chromate transporter [Geobacter]ABB32949.1 chromate transport protein ChrA, subunit 2, putative [Geobacter metallireducens GS-15]EHP88916.1 Chromate transporter [Geobacter metallireducens RCH3]MBT1076918.1 chromate transporter [Geobacter grbiciae]
MGSLATIAWTFLKIGLVFVGGGYVLIPLLHRIMVDQYHWLTMKEFLDGLALSQLTPGPLAILATFVGYRAGGFAGALVGTVAIFLPCTALMVFLTRRYERLRNIRLIREVLDGVVPAVVGLVASAGWKLGSTSLGSARDILLFVAGFAILQFTKVSPLFVILGAGALGYFLHFS